MSTTRPYDGPGFYLTGGFARSQGGQIKFGAPTGCVGGRCSPQAPAKPTQAAAPAPAPAIDPGRIYAARREAPKAAASKPADTLTHAGATGVYAQRR